ncbi:cysteinyl leukotriene receptor 1 [Echeneis naucrates]|uniref:Cysteinyl leukotriene receptor 1-like n=1 Tax=Echeneis naucrates TaxID=173247 RepID=A0A665WML5_ECHNA|nr:cysteinyl leukotriene receptor 1-like [Echeneis naucrates]XP_029369073.1 cysteinyl leukotriene receptor 1-like [Echeneis naucrates]XP_029369074.1 cysteinyl leukotriene receptor 1-like [Echeneis naucrates]XP_029369075.1 cysteinyl leukotriene receptor 1-like [Echeneis naucrates]XP_029369076.1 cysteinyl leukotriene receptor 1-like [Echeneis naucrates]XP_029369077.1 cysteinyl leukotriene receptor 1-like [Echeneis naucrates]XP_029369078.1 cysteinyl leukotriene receptor 1-like [Echeneis naucrate
MEQHNSSDSTACHSIDDFRNQVYSTSYSLITVCGLVGNGFALVVLTRTCHQSSPFHIYMFNLALADLLCVMTLPLRVIYYVNKGQWNLGDFLCRISSYSLYVNLYCSIYFMVAMSITRFLAIVYPVQNLRLVTENRARLVCAGIWVFICLLSSPFLMTGQTIDVETNKTKCFEPPNEKGLQKLVVLNYLSVVAGFALPFLVILLCYAGIVRTLLSRTHTARCQRDAGNRAIRMIVIVLLTFLISFTPYHVQRTIHLNSLSRTDVPCSEKEAMQKSVVVTLSLAAANSCFDPMLYFFSGEGFRNRLSSMSKSAMGGSSLQQTSRLRPVATLDGRENLQLQAS